MMNRIFWRRMGVVGSLVIWCIRGLCHALNAEEPLNAPLYHQMEKVDNKVVVRSDKFESLPEKKTKVTGGCIVGGAIQERKIDPIALEKLAHALGIPEGADLIRETQKRWLRKPGLERWEVEELPDDQRDFVLDWGKKHGLFDAWKPLKKTYDKALILGATTFRMQMRLDYLKQLWEEGIRFQEVVWLTGDRLLSVQADGLMDQCRTESEAARLIWKEAELPTEMKNLPVLFVAVPMKGPKRPTTEDTIIAWQQMQKEPCTVLFVSNQPFCGYQFSVVEACLCSGIGFDLVGQGIDPSEHSKTAAIALDAVARWIYTQEHSKVGF